MSDRPPKGIHYFNLGPWPVFCGFTTSEKAFQKEMKRLNIEDVNFLGSTRANATTHSFTGKDRALSFLITCRPYQARKVTKEQYAALIAHEAVHVIQVMSEELARGKPLGSEAEAYLVQQIVQESLQIAWQSNKVRRVEPA